MATGAMASVFCTTDTGTGRTVLDKIPRPEMESDRPLLNRLHFETAICRKLDHAGLMMVTPGERTRRRQNTARIWTSRAEAVSDEWAEGDL